jgi:predicted RNase H-like HicB family nuclease
MKIKAIIWQEDGVWCGSVPALPGCHTWGESYEQLLEMLEDAVQGWLEVASQQNELAPDRQLIELSLWNLYGKFKNIYRVLFTIRDTTVYVLYEGNGTAVSDFTKS